VAKVIQKGLEDHSFDVDIAYDGFVGKSMATNNSYSLIILDINLPIINGIELCREIRNDNVNVPIIMLTALGSNEDKIAGFDAGADDYILKPFNLNELIARVRVFLKRTGTGSTNQFDKILRIADLELHIDSKIAVRKGVKINLTPKEYLLLEYFMKNKGVVISRSEIAEKIWEITFDSGTNVIDVYVNYLRRKIDKDHDIKLIHTRTGLGYYLTDTEQ